jgi:hypothetical protein
MRAYGDQSFWNRIRTTPLEWSPNHWSGISQPAYAMVEDDDVPVPMRDGVTLLADVHRPAQSGRYPVLVAASPYPRQIQNLGAPAGFIEADASDFFVPRGYVHVIANCREPAAPEVPSASLTARSITTCTTSSSGPRNSPCATATSARSASVASP